MYHNSLIKNLKVIQNFLMMCTFSRKEAHNQGLCLFRNKHFRYGGWDFLINFMREETGFPDCLGGCDLGGENKKLAIA